MHSLNLALIGARTQVIDSFLEQLAKTEIEIDKLLLIGQESANDAIRFREKNHTIKSQEEIQNWADYDVVIVATSQNDFIQSVSTWLESGCFIIDATGALAKLNSIPLFVGLNQPIIKDEATQIKRQIALAHPLVRQLYLSITALLPIDALSNLKNIHLTQLLPVSFFGKEAIGSLATQSAQLLNGLSCEPNEFGAQIAFNLIPAPENERLNLNSIKLQVQRLLADFNLDIYIHSLVAPVFYGSVQTVSLQSHASFDVLALDHLNHDEAIFSALPTPVGVANPTSEEIPKIQITRAELVQSQSEQQLHYMSVADNVRDLGAKQILEALIAYQNGAFEG